MRSALGVSVLALVFVAAIGASQSQQWAFDVVSVKSAKPGSRLNVEVTGARFLATNIELMRLMRRVYAVGNSELFPNQIIGGAKWMETDHFDIEARQEGGVTIAQHHTWEMVRSLLEDRFQLKIHHETRQLPVYNLVVGKAGSKVKLSEDQTVPNVDSLTAPNEKGAVPFFDPKKPLPRGIFSAGGDPWKGLTVAGRAVPLSKLTSYIQPFVGRPVVDKTGVTGLVDLKFLFSPDCGILFQCGPGELTVSGPPLSEALEKELGLRLESGEGPVDVIVIDHADKPSEN